MKHDVKTTGMLVLWTFVLVCAGLLMVPSMQVIKTPGDVSGLTLAVIICGAIAVGTLMWFAVMRFANKLLEPLFAVVIAMMWVELARAVFRSQIWQLIIIYVGVYIGYSLLVNIMQRSWKNMWWAMHVSNFYIGFAIAAAAASFAGRLAPWVAILLLFVVAIYDAIAVWKTEHMQSFAMKFVEKRVIPGIGIAKKKEGKWAILGGGDVFFIVLVAGSFIKTSWSAAWLSAACMSAAVLLLFLFSSPKKFYPAIPFIFAGEIVAVLLMIAGVGI